MKVVLPEEYWANKTWNNDITSIVKTVSMFVYFPCDGDLIFMVARALRLDFGSAADGNRSGLLEGTILEVRTF